MSQSNQSVRPPSTQQDSLLRLQFAVDVSLLSPNIMFIFDETGSDNRNCIRKYGYSRCGWPLTTHKRLVRGERVSAIACMSMEGILDVKTVRGTTDGDDFYFFVQTHLLPHLQPFNCVNPHSVVILDNASVHHVPEVVQSIEEIGALVLFLPPYSPDYNPIEEAFSKVKTTLRSYDSMHTMHA